MFDFDKTVKKLKKFMELSGKKQKKLLNSIFVDPEFRDWFYGKGEAAKSQPKDKQMVTKLFSLLATPYTMRKIVKFMEATPYDEFDHTACSLTFLVADQAVEMSNTAVTDIQKGYQNGTMGSKEVKAYQERMERYNDIISELMSALHARSKDDVKRISSNSNLPKELVRTVYYMVPSRDMIQKFQTSMYMNQILREIYKYVGANGIENPNSVKWGPLFGSLFGNEMAASAAVYILLEGVRRIDNYRDTEYFDDVRTVWDSLTHFALNELDKAPDNVRHQMLDIYTKKLTNITQKSGGHSPVLRVDMLSDAIREFSNLYRTVSNYTERLAKITGKNTNRAMQVVNEYVNTNKISEKVPDDNKDTSNNEEESTNPDLFTKLMDMVPTSDDSDDDLEDGD